MSSKRFQAHDEFQEEQMRTIRRFTDNDHLPDIRVIVGGIIFSVDFKTTRNIEKNSHDMYFSLHEIGEKVAIVYNDRMSENKDDGDILAGWIENLVWGDSYPPSDFSRSGDRYYEISGGEPVASFFYKIKRHKDIR